MARVDANGVELEYESTGEGEPLVVIMGIGAQLVHWPQGFLRGLAEQGFRVITFDNRDAGLSSKFGEERPAKIHRLITGALLGRPLPAPYSLVDMAGDIAGLLDGLGLERAHILGVSMGGMIAQSMAIAYPERVKSLISIMSHPGNRRFIIGSHPRAVRVLLKGPVADLDGAMDRAEEFYRVVGSTGFTRDVEGIRRRAGIAYQRNYFPLGFARQMAAILSSGSRREALARVRAPSLVIHGSADPLIPAWGGRLTANAIPRARLRIIQGMGHDLPAGAWQEMHREIAAIAALNGSN